MTDEQKHAIEHAQKVLRAVKLYDLAASLGATQGADARPVAIYQQVWDILMDQKQPHLAVRMNDALKVLDAAIAPREET